LPQGHLSHLGPVCRSMLGENTYPPEPAILRGKKLPPTGNIMISRKVFNSVGLFDISMLSGGSDTDIALRIRAAGFVTWTAPNAVVHHLIPPYRLERAFLRITSLRWGSQLGVIHRKRFGLAKLLDYCLLRVGKALVIDMPRLILAYLKGDTAGILDWKCLQWRTIGYVRQTFCIVAPRLFLQRRFFAQLEFRKSRRDLLADIK